MKLRMAGTFSGIGGFEIAAQRYGWDVQSVTEIDGHCQEILAKQFPTAIVNGDINNVSARDIGTGLDLYAGGFPCQDTSIAAPNRAGLAGKRSGLYFQFTRLLDEYLRIVESTGPRWVAIENPPGLLKSNNGRDMLAVASGLEKLGYGWAYRVIDSHDFGSPQRRQRVIVVGHRGGDPRPAGAVLGFPGAGSEIAPAHPVGSRWESRPGTTGRDSGLPVEVWRKSARPRAALSAGGYETWRADGTANTLTGYDGGAATRQTHLVQVAGQRLRTLTPLEWERLQGFPDGWTAGVPTTARWTALGNALHVGTAEWLMSRLTAVHAAIPHYVGSAA